MVVIFGYIIFIVDNFICIVDSLFGSGNSIENRWHPCCSLIEIDDYYISYLSNVISRSAASWDTYIGIVLII